MQQRSKLETTITWRFFFYNQRSTWSRPHLHKNLVLLSGIKVASEFFYLFWAWHHPFDKVQSSFYQWRRVASVVWLYIFDDAIIASLTVKPFSTKYSLKYWLTSNQGRDKLETQCFWHDKIMAEPCRNHVCSMTESCRNHHWRMS